MGADLPIEQRWYAPLVKPVLPSVASALRQLEAVEDPWSMPRTGLGGAVAIHVAKGFGIRKWKRAGRTAVVALEGYNQRIHLGGPDSEERTRWLERDIDWVRKLWESVLDQDGATLRRTMDRLLGDRGIVCDRPIPEAVLFLRAAVAAGVVVGDVPDGVHQALDRHVTFVGLSWEAHRGTLDADEWDGALSAVGLREPFPEGPAETARDLAGRALEGLPDRPLVPLLRDMLARAPDESRLSPTRNPTRWQPMWTPELRSSRSKSSSEDSVIGAFDRKWRADIDAALNALSDSGSQVLGRATAYLIGQGGKRVRPLSVLAAAEAAGGPARRALPAAAAVEWLHQGSLVIDDIIDEATLRRGVVPLHGATSEAFAAGVAVFLFARVLRELHAMHPEIRKRLVRAATTLAEGERMELKHTGDHELSLTQYYRIIEGKTARVFHCAAAAGALSVEAPARTVRALERYGREAGLAFQIIDDLLDYVGDEGVLGKSPGTDLRAAKMTLPLILLRDRLASKERAQLASCLGEGEQLDWVLERLDEHDIPRLCQERAQAHIERAHRALSTLPPSEGREVLAALADRFVNRRC